MLGNTPPIAGHWQLGENPEHNGEAPKFLGSSQGIVFLSEKPITANLFISSELKMTDGETELTQFPVGSPVEQTDGSDSQKLLKKWFKVIYFIVF